MTSHPRFPRLMKLGPPIVVMGHRCSSCGRVAFPPDPYGCEQCGAAFDALDEFELGATGRIHSLATVHRHHDDAVPTPFTVATIVLDDGPSLKAMLTGTLDTLEVGMAVTGVAEPTGIDDDGNELVDLRFALSEVSR